MSEKAKILIFDLEVSTMRVETEVYSLKQYTPYLNHADITRPYAIHGAAWKWLDKENVHCVSVSSKDPFNDEAVVYRLYEVISQAHILVGHNLDRFDLRKFNTRAISHGLAPIGKIQTVDTLKLARKYFDFPSNSLSYLARHLKVGVDKDESPNWEAVRRGCPEALAYMRAYNKRDVDVTERVYLKLRSWHDNHPHVGNIQDVRDTAGERVPSCGACGSTDLRQASIHYTVSGEPRRRLFCKSCGAKRVQKRMKG